MNKVEQIVCESLTHRGYSITEAMTFLRVVKGEEVDPTPYEEDRNYEALQKGFETLNEKYQDLKGRHKITVEDYKSMKVKLERARKRMKSLRTMLDEEDLL